MFEIRQANDDEYSDVLAIINASAAAYKGVIPANCWHEPYMSTREISDEIAAGVVFRLCYSGNELAGVMGLQEKSDVTLIRHAYVLPSNQRQGIGTGLLNHVRTLVTKPLLVGTWADASWAIDFYIRNGFSVVSDEQKEHLLKQYLSVPKRQIENSVVLADRRWIRRQA